MDFFKASLGIAAGLMMLSSVVKSQHFSGTAVSNPRGGLDVTAALSKTFGDAKANAGGGVFASGNTMGGPVSRGAFLEANKNGHGLSLQHTTTDNFGKTLTAAGRANLLQNDKHKLDAIASHSRTHLHNGFKFDRLGGGLDYNHAGGHGASLTGSRIPQLNMNTLDLTGKANLWTSPNRATTLDLQGGASKHFGGPFDGQFSKRVGLGLTSQF